MTNSIIVSASTSSNDRIAFGDLAVQNAKLLRDESSDSSMISANFFDLLAEYLNNPNRTFHECKDIMKHLSYYVFDTNQVACEAYDKLYNWLQEQCKAEWWISE